MISSIMIVSRSNGASIEISKAVSRFGNCSLDVISRSVRDADASSPYV